MNAEQIAHVMSLVDEFAFVAGQCGVDHARDGNSNGRKAEFNDARQRVEDAIAALSAEGGADYLPVHRVAIAEIETVGKRCLDSGKCHHNCVDRCFRRDGCVPLSIADSYLNDDWTLKARSAAAATGDMVLVPREEQDALLAVVRESCYGSDLGRECRAKVALQNYNDAMKAAQQEPQ